MLKMSERKEKSSQRKSIRMWKESERPRERLLANGAEALSDAELLAIILRTGGRKKDAVQVARGLLEKYGGFRGFEDVSVKELSGNYGVGLTKAIEIKACLEIAKRYFREKYERVKVKNADDVLKVCVNYIMPYLRDMRREFFVVVLLNSKNEVIRIHKVSIGTLDTSLVHPREVLKEAIKESASGIIAVHNHPSGDPTPSPQDIETTKKLMKACELVGIRFVDHVIVGDNSLYSFFEKGLLEKIND